MRPAPTLLLLAFLGCISLPVAAQVGTLQVTDASASGCPIHISGTITVAESVETSTRCNSLQVSRCSVEAEQYNLAVSNVSREPIVAFAAKMEGRTRNGNSRDEDWREDRIFGHLFGPGENEDWPGGGGVHIRPERTEAEPATPSAQARIVFVQFADGSIFGDRKAGEKLLLMRQESLKNLARLEAVYVRGGEKTFDKAAQQPGAGGMLGIGRMEKQDGPAATVAHIRHMLATAKERLAAMTAQAGR